MDKKQLWLNLKAYHFDNLVSPNVWDHIKEKFGGGDASTRAFADKITRKTGWSNKFSLNAISEYKKFVYLGVVSDFAATPSKVIDKVWHQHILFSKAYREFCTNVIRYDFDHSPELIPMTDQTGTFNAQYLDTIELYKTEFGVNPPASIWSIPKFDKETVPSNGYESKKKRTTTFVDDTPLYSYFPSDSSNNLNTFPEFHRFEGGSGGGAGTSDSWDSSGINYTGSDSGHSGSSCSSGCSSCGGGD
ncbi:MAG: glycine-rich domain-containing protein [Chitinophagaceae bacterium]